MSIYISIATLEDPDITSTVLTAINGAANKDDIRIGIAAAVSNEFYIDYLLPIQDLPQIDIRRYPRFEMRGIGKGRSLARLAYNNEDFILQIDSHTLFTDRWDEILIDLYCEAQERTGNEKTILTCYLGRHHVVNGEYEIIDKNSRYCVFSPTQFNPAVRVQQWEDRSFRTFPREYPAPNDLFLPANKVGAHFMFGKRDFAMRSGLPRSAVFFEEEIIQTINLLERGYALVFPNTPLPLTHRYIYESDNVRESGRNLYGTTEDPTLLMTRSMYDFVVQNREACQRYADYACYDIITGMVRPFHIPETFEYGGKK